MSLHIRRHIRSIYSVYEGPNTEVKYGAIYGVANSVYGAIYGGSNTEAPYTEGFSTTDVMFLIILLRGRAHISPPLFFTAISELLVSRGAF